MKKSSGSKKVNSNKRASGGLLLKGAGPGRRNIVLPISIQGGKKNKLDFKKLDQKNKKKLN